MGTVNLDEAMETLEILLGIKDDEQNSLLSFLLDDCVNMILGYCRLEELPRQLESLVPVIAADMYRAKDYGQQDAPQTVKSISEGQRSVSYESVVSDTDELLKDYRGRLKPYVNRRGRVPSELR